MWKVKPCDNTKGGMEVIWNERSNCGQTAFGQLKKNACILIKSITSVFYQQSKQTFTWTGKGTCITTFGSHILQQQQKKKDVLIMTFF